MSSEENNKHEIVVTLSPNYYEAYISIDIERAAAPITKDDIKRALTKKNVTFGIETHIIEEIVKEQQSVRDVVIARGVPHRSGKNGEISYHFDTSLQVRPTVNDDGTVDFKDMHYLHMAEKGQVLATRTLPTEGVNGTTVTNKIISGRSGKIVNFKVGKNVETSEDGLQLSASCLGNIQFDNGKISVIDVLEINEDVGVSTGNIEFSGHVIINGNVTRGYSVKSDLDVVINGIVEAATIKSAGNIIINGGIQGSDQADIYADGNITAKFINNANVFCKGNIEADAIMHARIDCAGSMTLKGKRALIVGGEINCRYDIKARTLGSEMGTLTQINLGIDADLMAAYHSSEQKIKDINASLKKLSQAATMLKKQYEATQSDEIKQMMNKTDSSRAEYAAILEDARAEFKRQNNIINTLKGSKIIADAVFPGVRVKISNSFYHVKKKLDHVRLIREDGEIKIRSAS